MISPGEGDKRGHFPKPRPSSQKVEETRNVSAGTRRAVSGMAGRTTVNLLPWTVIWGSTNLLFLIVAASQGGISVLFVGSIPLIIALVALFWKRQHPVALMVSALPFTLLFSAMAMPGSHPPETAWQRQERERQGVTTVMALYEQCRSKVASALKAPATARFASAKDVVIQQDYDGYVVRSYVDAQNPMGAFVRTDFVCHLVRGHDGHLEIFKTELFHRASGKREEW